MTSTFNVILDASPYALITTDNIKMGGNGRYIRVPQMTTGNLPGTPAAGMLLFNTTDNQLEVYTGTAWVSAQSKTANRTITVAKDGSGNFTTIKAAQAAIGAGAYPVSSTDNRYLIIVMPSSDVTDTVYHEANPILWNKQYVSLCVWGGHDTVKIVGDNDDDMLVISVSDCEFTNINVRRAAPSTAGKAAFKITGAADDVVFVECKSMNFDIAWLNTVGDNRLSNCSMNAGTCANFIKVTGGRIGAFDCYALIGVTMTDYTCYVTGAGSGIYLFNFHDESANGGSKDGGAYVEASGYMMVKGAYFKNGTNGLYCNGGTIHAHALETDSCTNGIRAAGTGRIELNGCEIINSGTYDIVQVNSTCPIIGVAVVFNVSKVSIVANSTTIDINEVQERDTIPYVAGSWNLISEMTAQFTGVNVPQNMTNLGYRLIFVNVTGLVAAGTLNLTTVGPGSGSYNPVTGATTPGDSEAIPIAATGWYVSTKRWFGTVNLAGAGGLNLTMTDYKVGRAEQNVPFILRLAKFVTNGAGGGPIFQVVIEKWDKTNGITTVWDSNVVLGNTVINGQQFTFMRDGLNTSFNSDASPPEFMIVRFVGLSSLGTIRMILDKELGRF